MVSDPAYLPGVSVDYSVLVVILSLAFVGPDIGLYGTGPIFGVDRFRPGITVVVEIFRGVSGPLPISL